MSDTPTFSIVITTFNRRDLVTRCVATCLGQSDLDFELIVVDDASTDDTIQVLTTRFGDRLRLVRHDTNQGINPAGNSGVAAARGVWVVVVDSDWELVPETLARLRVAIASRPAGVRAIRSLLRWDDGSVSPPEAPDGVIDYAERIRWLERLLGHRTDAGRCFERALLQEIPYISGRRGAMEMLWELRVARGADAICLHEVLGVEQRHRTASYRGDRRREVIRGSSPSTRRALDGRDDPARARFRAPRARSASVPPGAASRRSAGVPQRGPQAWAAPRGGGAPPTSCRRDNVGRGASRPHRPPAPGLRRARRSRARGSPKCMPEPGTHKVWNASWLRAHLADPLYRTGYFLIAGAGITSVLGVAFWALAARGYSAATVGLNAAAISAMTLVSGVCSLGLSAVLVRYLPGRGRSDAQAGVADLLAHRDTVAVAGAVAAASSSVWSPSLAFLQNSDWLVGFALATAATTVFTLQDSVLTGLRVAKWVPLENSLYSLGKLALLIAFAAALPASGPFAAWSLPLLPAVVVVNYFVFRHVIPKRPESEPLDRTTISMAASNYGGRSSPSQEPVLPILVADLTSAEDAAYFYVPWLISMSLQLVALNLMASLTVEAALNATQTRDLVRQAFFHAMRVVLPLAGVVVIAAPWILLVFGSAYADAGTPLLRWLAIGTIPSVVVSTGSSRASSIGGAS